MSEENKYDHKITILSDIEVDKYPCFHFPCPNIVHRRTILTDSEIKHTDDKAEHDDDNDEENIDNGHLKYDNSISCSFHVLT